MDIKSVSKIPQRYKDIVFGFIKEAQSLFPDNNSFFNIVDLIIHLILLYYHTMFESSILNETEKEQLLNLFKQNNKEIVNYPWNLIFDSRKDKICRAVFGEKVHKKSNVLLLIRLRGECVIGGYTKTGWINEENKDKDAFLFYLKSAGNYKSFISSIKQDEDECMDQAVGYRDWGFAGFGTSWALYFSGGYFEMQSVRYADNYEPYPSEHGNHLLAGSQVYDHLDVEHVELEVFQIQM